MAIDVAMTQMIIDGAGLDQDAVDSRAQLSQFLGFYLPPDMTALLPLEQLIEILKIAPTTITPIPQMPNWVTGVCNWRGEVLWIVDLGSLVGLTSWYQQDNLPAYASVLVITAHCKTATASMFERRTLGLIVNRVEDIEWLDLSKLQSPPVTAVTEALAPFLSGYWLSSRGNMLTLLNGDAIFDRLPS